RDVFFRTRESGGTMISSAYKLCAELIEAEFDPEQWNIYAFHFSDGDNWSVDDTATCIQLVKQQLLPKCNQFGYGQAEAPTARASSSRACARRSPRTRHS